MSPTLSIYNLTRPTTQQAAAEREEWRDRAACAGMEPELFFPPEGLAGVRQTEAAKTICRSCPVRVTCLAESKGERFGVWGGVRRG